MDVTSRYNNGYSDMLSLLCGYWVQKVTIKNNGFHDNPESQSHNLIQQQTSSNIAERKVLPLLREQLEVY